MAGKPVARKAAPRSVAPKKAAATKAAPKRAAASKATPKRAPASRAAPKRAAVSKTAPKTAPTSKVAASKVAATKVAARKSAPRKASASKARPEAATKRFYPAPKPVEQPALVTEPLPEIPAELLVDAPKSKKPRKPRGKKAEAPKPTGALDTILAQLDDAKAEQIVTIPLDDKSAVADAVVVASGRSNRHVGAIADQLVMKLKEQGHRDLRIEGMPQCDWVLVDAGDVVVHIFRPEVRSFYNLEKLLSAHSPEEWTAQ